MPALLSRYYWQTHERLITRRMKDSHARADIRAACANSSWTTSSWTRRSDVVSKSLLSLRLCVKLCVKLPVCEPQVALDEAQ